MNIKDGDLIKVNLLTGLIENTRTKTTFKTEPFSEVQFEVYRKGGLLDRSEFTYGCVGIS